jgi:hypothetical protein
MVRRISMVTLEGDRLVFRFPDVHEEARLAVTFQRTLRIPDDDQHYPLPPGLGAFPLRHLDDYRRRLPKAWVERGGVLMPMHQAEAMWISFRGDYPMAVTVAAGKVNAITGSAMTRGLHRRPQDYLVTPEQPWLDGFCVEKGAIRQFVAMPLGQGYSVEEQISRTAEHGGLQLIVRPLKAASYRRLQRERGDISRRMDLDMFVPYCRLSSDMGLAPGGRMRQEVYEDPFESADWAQKHVSRCFIAIVNGALWAPMTGETPPSVPPTASDYTEAGLPWFEYYNPGAVALPGSDTLAKAKSVKTMSESKGISVLPENQSVDIQRKTRIHPLRPRRVREGSR